MGVSTARRNRNHPACHSERSEESACCQRRFFAALRITGTGCSGVFEGRAILTFITPQHHDILTRVIRKRKNAHMLIESQGRKFMQGSKEKKQVEREMTENVPTTGKTAPGNSVGRGALIAALALVLIAGLSVGAVAIIRNTNFVGITPASNSGNTASQSSAGNSALATNANGVVNFIDAPGGSGHSNEITISINGLQTPPSGSQYDAWFIDTSTRHVLALGALALKNSAYTLTYSNNGANLVGLGDEIEITLEHGAATKPAQDALLSAAFPTQALVYVRHMLYNYTTTPGHAGLLVGLIEQARLLNAVTHILTTNPNALETRCIAQAALDIMEGKASADY